MRLRPHQNVKKKFEQKWQPTESSTLLLQKTAYKLCFRFNFDCFRCNYSDLTRWNNTETAEMNVTLYKVRVKYDKGHTQDLGPKVVTEGVKPEESRM